MNFKRKNGLILPYGYSGKDKSHSLFGNAKSTEAGILNYICKDIFQSPDVSNNKTVQIKVYEIYNTNKINDLDKKKKKFTIKITYMYAARVI